MGTVLFCLIWTYDLYALGRDHQMIKNRSTAWCWWLESPGNFQILLPNPKILSSGASILFSLTTFHILWEEREVYHLLNVHFPNPKIPVISHLLSHLLSFWSHLFFLDLFHLPFRLLCFHCFSSLFLCNPPACLFLVTSLLFHFFPPHILHHSKCLLSGPSFPISSHSLFLILGFHTFLNFESPALFYQLRKMRVSLPRLTKQAGKNQHRFSWCEKEEEQDPWMNRSRSSCRPYKVAVTLCPTGRGWNTVYSSLYARDFSRDVMGKHTGDQMSVKCDTWQDCLPGFEPVVPESLDVSLGNLTCCLDDETIPNLKLAALFLWNVPPDEWNIQPCWISTLAGCFY